MTVVLRSVSALASVALVASIAAGTAAFAASQIDGAATASVGAARVQRGAAPAAPPATSAESAMAARVIELVNAERARRGRDAFATDDLVTAAAEIHSDDMAAHQNMSHTGSDGSNTGDRLERVGFSWRGWGENIGAGYADAAAMVDGWMNSTGHREIILSDNTFVGVSVIPAADGRLYWTLVVAS